MAFRANEEESGTEKSKIVVTCLESEHESLLSSARITNLRLSVPAIGVSQQMEPERYSAYWATSRKIFDGGRICIYTYVFI